MGLAISAVLAFVSGILTYGILVPEDLRVFILLAAAASMAGYALGDVTAKSLKVPIARAMLIAVSFIVCAFSFLKYVVDIQQENATTADVIWLGVWLTIGFFGLTFLMAACGITMSSKP